MDTYTIKKAFPWSKSKYLEIEISSENLLYTELQNTHSGCQTNSENTDKIHLRCKEIANLIREIEELSCS